MPVRRRADAWGFSFGWKGRTYRRSSRHWDREKAGEAERKLLDDLHAIAVGRQPRRSFYEAVEKWKLDELPNYADPARELAHMAAIAPFIEDKMLDEAPEAAAAMKRAWAKRKAGTVNRRLALVRRLVNLAWKEWGWLDQPIGRKIGLLTDRGARHVYPTARQAGKLAAKMPRSGGYVLMAGYTGIRRGQLLRLDGRRDVVKVPKVGPCLNLGTHGKTGNPQLIPLHPKVRRIAPKLPLCTAQILREEWEAARKALGLGHVRFNDLRHAAASWLLHSGASLLHVRDLLGHTTVRTTQRYTHLQVAHLHAAVRKMGR